MTQGKVRLHRFLHILRSCGIPVGATEQRSGLFLRNHLRSKKNTSVIIVVTLRNYPHATPSEERKTTVSLPPRSSSKRAGRFTALRASKEASLSCSCVNTVMKQENSADCKASLFKVSEARSTYILFLSHWRRGGERRLFAVVISPRASVPPFFVMDSKDVGRPCQEENGRDT